MITIRPSRTTRAKKWELDVIAICCDWTEYGPGELVEAYGYMVERTEWDDENAGLYDDEAERDEAYLNDLRAELEQQTTIIELDATCLVMDFLGGGMKKMTDIYTMDEKTGKIERAAVYSLDPKQAIIAYIMQARKNF